MALALLDTPEFQPAVAPVRAVLADDNSLFRRGLRSLLGGAGIEIVGEASDGRAAVRLAAELRPDIVVMDTDMPVLDGIEATRQIRAAAESCAVLVLTAKNSEAALDAILAGARGLLLKTATADEIVAGVRLAATGESALSPAVAGQLVARMCVLEAAQRERVMRVTERALTLREQDVLKLLAEGRDNPGIGAELYISPSTVKHHVAAILEKLGVQNRVQAAVEAVRIGLA